jgi:hypothetical protein
MHIKFRTRLAALAAGIAARLGREIDWEVAGASAAVEGCALRCSPDIDPAMLADLLAALRPIELVCRRIRELPSDRVEIDLAVRPELSTWKIVIHAEAGFAGKVAESMKALGFTRVHVKKQSFVATDRMLYGGASAFARQVVAWGLREYGCHPVEVKEWHDGDHDIFLHLVAPAHRGVPARQRLPVSVATDRGDAAEAIIEAVRQAGFGAVRATVTDTLAGMSQIGVDPGLLAACEDEGGIGVLLGIAQRFADEAGLDPLAFPVRRLPPKEDQPKLYLPIEAIRRGVLAPYAGSYPARFRLCLCTDDRAAGLVLTRAFEEHGFREVIKRAVHDFSQGFVIFSGPAGDEPRVVELIRDTLEREMVRQGILGYPISFLPGSDSNTIEVVAPFRACRDGTLLRELANPKRFSLTVTGPEPMADEIGDYACEIGFTAITIRHPDAVVENAGWIEYGGAPRELIDQLRDGIAERFGKALFLRARKSWPVTDMTITITLPPPPNPRPARRRLWSGLSGVRPATSAPDAPPFIDVGAKTVRVGRVVLARRGGVHPMVPQLDALLPFCIDPKTATNLEFLAYSVSFGEPSLLVGPTSSSKTAAVRFLAALVGQPLARLNLHGHSDSGELIGRFTPEPAGGWAWRDGFVPRGMREGLWLLIDEVNLAEAQVVERLNSVLEQPPTLVVGEHASEAITQAHPAFWICATANPAGQYAGRSAMSPAFRDRYIATSLVPAPAEEDFLAYLRLCVHGVQPAIEVNGVAYGATAARPIYPRLAGIREIDPLLTALARFHAGAAAAMAAGTNPSSAVSLEGEEAPTFTRRGLAACLRFMDACAGNATRQELAGVTARAISRYYLDRVAPEQASPIRELAQAAGLH